MQDCALALRRGETILTFLPPQNLDRRESRQWYLEHVESRPRAAVYQYSYKLSSLESGRGCSRTTALIVRSAKPRIETLQLLPNPSAQRRVQCRACLDHKNTKSSTKSLVDPKMILLRPLNSTLRTASSASRSCRQSPVICLRDNISIHILRALTADRLGLCKPHIKDPPRVASSRLSSVVRLSLGSVDW